MRLSCPLVCEQRRAKEGTLLRYYDIGYGDVPVVLLHGLFGSPSNWLPIMHDLEQHYRFLALQFPIDSAPEGDLGHVNSIGQLTDHVASLFDELELDRAVIVGNSLGGQVGLDYYLRHPERVERLVLAGSAGLFENNLAGGRRLRLSRQFIREQALQIFYDPALVCDELVDDIFGLLNDRGVRKLTLRVAKSTRDRYMLDDLSRVDVPTLLVWGKDDKITPPFVAEQFRDHIRDSKCVLLDKCGHAPAIEQPAVFARVLHDFLGDLLLPSYVPPRKPR